MDFFINTIHFKSEGKDNSFFYVYVFSLEEYEKGLIRVLKQLKIDFKNVENKIFINKIYFSGLTTVINSFNQ